MRFWTWLIVFGVGLLLSPAARAADHSEIHRHLLAGRIAHARQAVTERLTKDVPLAERAALLELLGIVEAWKYTGPPAAIEMEDLRAADDASSGLDIGREYVVIGAYRTAVGRLSSLGDAVDPIDAARATELRQLALEALHPPAKPSPGEPPMRSYALETLAVDALAAGATVIHPLAGAGLYLAGAPVIHLLHGNARNAGISVAIRAGAPAVGAAAAMFMSGIFHQMGHGGADHPESMMITLASLGAFTAVVIDAAALAKAPAKTVQPTASLRPGGGFDVGLTAAW
jgi:hypothetical protein